jgi:hypothetical protein
VEFTPTYPYQILTPKIIHSAADKSQQQSLKFIPQADPLSQNQSPFPSVSDQLLPQVKKLHSPRFQLIGPADIHNAETIPTVLPLRIDLGTTETSDRTPPTAHATSFCRHHQYTSAANRIFRISCSISVHLILHLHRIVTCPRQS